MKKYFFLLSGSSFFLYSLSASAHIKPRPVYSFSIQEVTCQKFLGGPAGSGITEVYSIRLMVNMRTTKKGLPVIEEIIVRDSKDSTRGISFREFRIFQENGKTVFYGTYRKGENIIILQASRYYPGRADEMMIENAETDEEKKIMREAFNEKFNLPSVTLSEGMNGKIFVKGNFNQKRFYCSASGISSLPVIPRP